MDGGKRTGRRAALQGACVLVLAVAHGALVPGGDEVFQLGAVVEFLDLGQVLRPLGLEVELALRQVRHGPRGGEPDQGRV